MKKRFELIAKGLLLLFMAVPMATATVMAQDDAYLTPSRAKELRAKARAEREALKKKMAEKLATEEARKQKARQQYQEDVSDWYNRRDMKVTIEEMEQNLDQLDGTSNSTPTTKNRGGKYSKRLRRFDGDNNDVIVLQNVERVYVIDGYDYYDPWTQSYYARDWNNGVNIIINQGAPWRYGWNYGYPGWGYPYYGYYDPWLDPWYYRGPSFYWGYSRPWGGIYLGWGGYRGDYYGGYWGGYWGGYRHSYWNGYTDGRRDRYYSTPRSSYGRSSGSYYDRSSHSSIYGRALGNSTRTIESSSGYYDRTTRSFQGYDNNRSRNTYNNNRVYNNTNTRTSRWDRNANNYGNNGNYNNRTTTPSRSTGTYSTPSRSTNNSNTTTTTTSSTGRRVGR